MNTLASKKAQASYLLYMDLDDFRRVNTVVGFAEGNEVLKKCGQAISEMLPAGDNLFRINGSRFALIHYGSMASSQNLAASVIEQVNGASELRTNTYFRQGISIGITALDKEKDFNTIVNQAEMAMYKVKENKKNDYEFFNELHEREYKNLLALEAKLKNATNEKVWKVYLQPQVDVKTGKIHGLEALIRWFDGQRYIPPDEFIPLAEKNGLIVRIGDDVIQKVFSLMEDCQRRQMLDIKFSINVSAVEMFDSSFVERMAMYLETYDVDPTNVTLELTETAILANIEEAQAIMTQLRNMKLSLSIDDFGSGFTSLSYLSYLPIDEVKLDKGFIDHIVDNGRDRIMLGHFTELCHDLGLKVVAEGIETEEQLQCIEHIGCDLYQGYYFSKPLSYDKMCHSFGKETGAQTS
jgi:diguanylate cyclase (GGDEF)-like protein